MKLAGGPPGFPLVVDAHTGHLRVAPRAITVVVHDMFIPDMTVTSVVP